jgi:hypothetical protein
MDNLADRIRMLVESDHFDQDWYVEYYPDVARSAMSPAEHFIRIGQPIGRRPNGKANGNESVAVIAKALSARKPVPQSEPPTKTYEQYKSKIFARIATLSNRYPQPADLFIDTDYTGPPHATAFDSFISKRQEKDSVTQMLKMLDFGIVAINPQPGVHAARTASGDFIRYKSILAQTNVIETLPPSMLIHIHAFYPDVVEEMLDYFVGEAKKGRFLVTTTTKKNFKEITEIFEDRGFLAYEVLLIDNKGRDIGPFLDYAIDYSSDGDVICHVHTKKSPDVGGSYGEKWRNQLYGALLTQNAVDAFEDPRLGLLFPDTPRSVGWGKNLPFCSEIAQHFDRPLGNHPGPMPIGNMFFARREVAMAMRQATSRFSWPREPVAYDGTILHAIERMWTMAAEYAGMEWAAVHSRYVDDAGVSLKSKAASSRR